MLNTKQVINDLLYDAVDDLEDILKVAKVLKANEECLEKLLTIKGMITDCIKQSNNND